MRKTVASWRTAFPDYHITVEDVIAEGDRVVVNLTYAGTHTGPFHYLAWHIAPTGKHFGGRQIIIYRVAGGKVVEAWSVWEALAHLEQLGATLTLPAAPTPA